MQISEYEQVIRSLSQFPSREWINLYFDLLKRLITEFEIERDDPRLGLSLKKDKQLPVNLGQRYILKPYTDRYIGIIVPLGFAEEAVRGETVFYFSTNKINDAKFISLPFDEKAPLPAIVYNACTEACADILKRSKKTGFKKFHSPLLYDFTMEPAVRNEILNEVKILHEP